jgi:hypothetical protein
MNILARCGLPHEDMLAIAKIGGVSATQITLMEPERMR